MVAQVVAILALILGARSPARASIVIGQAALWVVVVTALVSAADYFRRFNVVLEPARRGHHRRARRSGRIGKSGKRRR